MKKLLLVIPALLFSLLTFSQGIVFEHGTWKEVLAKAQKTNKPIFVDVFTTWCGPCKQMSSNIFPLEIVGKVFNENFICYQIDAEKGEGIAIAKKYGVKAYPTYLFVKGDGTLFNIAVGSMPEKEFVSLSKSALLDMNDPKPLAIWENDYIVKKNDSTFLKDYIDKRSKLGLSNTQLFDEYLKLIPEGDRTSAYVIAYYRKEGNYLRVNSFAFANLRTNYSTLVVKTWGMAGVWLLAGIMNTIDDAGTTKNETLFATALSVIEQLPKGGSSIMLKDEAYMQYYKKTGETDKYFTHAISYGKNYFMKKNIDSLAIQDRKKLETFENRVKSGIYSKFDSATISVFRLMAANSEVKNISTGLNKIAWDAFKQTTDKNHLQGALILSKRSLEITPNDAVLLDTKANLLYKLDLKQEAIATEKEALRYADVKDIKGYKGMEETLRKMTAGEKTWK